MRTFTDNAGRAWTVSINVDAVRKVRAEAGVDLLEVADGKLIDRLAEDPVLLCGAIYACCREQAEARNISPEDFGRAMAGDAIDAAVAAFLEDLVDFFPSRRRPVLRKVLEKFRAMEGALVRTALERLDSPELDARLQDEMSRACSGGLPGLPGPTPAP